MKLTSVTTNRLYMYMYTCNCFGFALLCFSHHFLIKSRTKTNYDLLMHVPLCFALVTCTCF